jgi:thiamine biosynthesis lipoprotein
MQLCEETVRPFESTQGRARSATVIGPDGGLADAMATALMVTGDDGANLFGQEELAQYSAWCINRHEGSAWGVGDQVQ